MKQLKPSTIVNLIFVMTIFVSIIIFFVVRDILLRHDLEPYVYSDARARAINYFATGKKVYYVTPSNNSKEINGISVEVYSGYVENPFFYKIFFVDANYYVNEFVITFNQEMKRLIEIKKTNLENRIAVETE
ncbi:MAG: hypothetical protein WC071_11870 [Victivallaceae bacterium]